MLLEAMLQNKQIAGVCGKIRARKPKIYNLVESSQHFEIKISHVMDRQVYVDDSERATENCLSCHYSFDVTCNTGLLLHFRIFNSFCSHSLFVSMVTFAALESVFGFVTVLLGAPAFSANRWDGLTRCKASL